MAQPQKPTTSTAAKTTRSPRPSQRLSQHLSITPPGPETESLCSNPNVFDDEYAVDDAISFSDRSSSIHNDSPVATSANRSGSSDRAVIQGRQDALRSKSLSRRPVGSSKTSATADSRTDVPLVPLAQRSSQSAKSRTSLPRKSLSGSSHANSSLTSLSTTSPDIVQDDSHPQRTLSVASSMVYARSHSPFQGASGPSHPYGMYPQDAGLARSASTTTSSTLRPPSLHTPGAGPSHPYALYSQNVISDGEDASHAFQNLIPVGFTGQNQTFHRRIGPEGEELDIIGPDGHSEQLPPYTRFPDTMSLRSHMPAIGETPTDSLMPDDGSLLRFPRNATGISGESDLGSSTLQGTVNGGQSEKSWKEKSWKERRSTLVCGCIPLWGIWAMIALIPVAIIIGVAIGIAGHHSGGPPNQSGGTGEATVTVTQVTTLVDASSIATATPSVVTGTWVLPFEPADQQNDGCLTASWQNPAWNCSLVQSNLPINVYWPNNGTTPHACYAEIGSQYGGGNLGIGELPPYLPAQELSLVVDNDAPELGPAFHFQTMYNKKVILPQNALHPPNNKRDRLAVLHGIWSGSMVASGSLIVGNHYWFCEFNATFIEVFIYLFPNATGISATPVYSPVPSTATMAASTAAVVSSATSHSSLLSSTVPVYTRAADMVAPDKIIKRTPSPTSTPHRRTLNYPRRVKLEEQRVAGTPPGQCSLKQYMNDGTLQPFPEANPQIIDLQETDPADMPERLRRRILQARDTANPMDTCHCQWETP